MALRRLKTLGCDNCDKEEDEKPMVYRGEPWCSENCKEALSIRGNCPID